MPKFLVHINGEKKQVETAGSTPLLWVLRDELKLTGTKYGCGRGFCGACTIHLDGEETRSCITAIEDAQNSEITTIEGLSQNSDHPVQKAWIAEDVPQCGYCQSGQIMAAVSLLERKPNPTDQEIDRGMLNLCRCGTYPRVRKAIHRPADMMTEVP